ncbi:MAG: chemotaxis protein CheA [Firmicutes bacterium]|nr:chemotaxis protein CheA [Bacillota bacterium]
MEMSQYLEMFMEEAKEHIQTLNTSLLYLEQNPHDKEVVGELFRAAHTLKGMAATMGFERTAQLTHRMESSLDLVRQDKLTPDSNFITALLRAVDVLEELVESAADGQEDQSLSIEPIMAALPVLADATQPAKMEVAAAAISELDEHARLVLDAAVKQGMRGYRLDVRLAPGALLKSARAYMVFQRLEQHGEIIHAEPGVPDLEEERFDDEFSLWVITDSSGEALQDEVENIVDVREVTVVPLAGVAGQTTLAEPSQELAHVARLRTGKSVRVDISRLDRLMNLVSELVITRTRLTQISRDLGSTVLADTTASLNRILLELQDEVMQVRMVAVEQIFNRFPRMIRDLSQQLGKEVDFIISGQETELDRTIVDEIGEPLIHLLRNALDHGIEAPAERERVGKPAVGQLRLSAYHRGESVFIEVQDDGRGIDATRVKQKAVERGLLTEDEANALDDEGAYKLLFQSGFSTAEQVSDVSGRGVGLDAVASKIASLGGRTLIHSELGVGTTFTIVLPLTLAIMATLQVRVGDERYAIPLSVVDQTALLKRRDLTIVQHRLSMSYQGQTIPVVDLRQALEVDAPNSPAEDVYIVVVYRGRRLLGLMVDELLGQEEVVVKPLGPFVDRCPGVSGATILGDGSIALILDVMSIV